MMSVEFDDDLTAEQWDALRSLRLPASKCRIRNQFAVERLIALGLAVMTGDRPTLTAKGRTVLIRGSSQLLDIAA
jgi:hypothetical protein